MGRRAGDSTSAPGSTRRSAQPWRTTETFETAPGVYDWTRQAGQRWFLRAATELGVLQFLAFSLRDCADDAQQSHPRGQRHSSNLKPGMEPDYARYLADILEHFETNPVRRSVSRSTTSARSTSRVGLGSAQPGGPPGE